jgi:hypothetical protein
VTVRCSVLTGWCLLFCALSVNAILQAAAATVLREGRLQQVQAADLVPGDIVELAGKRPYPQGGCWCHTHALQQYVWSGWGGGVGGCSRCRRPIWCLETVLRWQVTTLSCLAGPCAGWKAVQC